MAKNECPKCLEKINKLLGNKESGFVEGDREWLEALSETHLDRVIAMKFKEVEKIVEKPVEVNKLTPEQVADLAFVANQRKERRNKMVKEIQENTEAGTWDEPTLNAMSEDVLDKVHKSVKKKESEVVDYSLNGGTINVNQKTSSGGMLLPPGVKEETVNK